MKKKEKESRSAAADHHVDRISDLPEEIIHGILYRMDSPSEAARTSILSRRWLHLWRSYPVLEFRDPPNRRCWSEHEQTFRSFSAASSRRLYNSSGSNNLVAPMALPAVRLSLLFSPNWCAEILRDHKLQHEISPIEISVKLPKDCYYHDQSNMPALCWNFSRTKVLKLVNFHSRVPGIDLAAVTMESLEVLHLDSVSIGDETLCSLLSNAPNLRELSLIEVYDEVNLKSPLLQLEVLHLQGFWKISQEALCILLCNSPKLATVSLMESFGYRSKLLERLAIDLPNLKSLRIAGRPLSIHIISAPLLHTLELLNPYFLPKLTVESPSSSALNLRAIVINNFSEKYIQLVNVNQLSLYFPSLHSVSLTYHELNSGINPGGAGLQLSSSKLRRLSFSRWPHWLPLHIDAPNCLTLHYSLRDSRYLPTKFDVANLAPSCQCVFDLSSGFVAIPHSWFRRFRKFLAMSVQSHPHLNVLLKVGSLQSLEQVDSLDAIQASCTLPPLVVQHLKLGTNLPQQFGVTTAGAALLTGILATCHPRFLSITHHSRYNPFSTYICEQLLKREDVDSCRSCYDVKCWRHQFKDVKLKSDIEGQAIEISEDNKLISSLLNRAKVTFEFTWD